MLLCDWLKCSFGTDNPSKNPSESIRSDLVILFKSGTRPIASPTKILGIRLFVFLTEIEKVIVVGQRRGAK